MCLWYRYETSEENIEKSFIELTTIAYTMGLKVNKVKVHKK